MPSTIEQHYYRDFDYSSPTGSHYRLWFENFNEPIDQYNRFRRLKVEVSTDDKLSWSSLPLAPKSRLDNAIVAECIA
jgi:hypothetical protein